MGGQGQWYHNHQAVNSMDRVDMAKDHVELKGKESQ